MYCDHTTWALSENGVLKTPIVTYHISHSNNQKSPSGETRIVSVPFLLFCGAALSNMFLNMAAHGACHNCKWPSPQAAILRSGFVKGQPQALQVQVIKY